MMRHDDKITLRVVLFQEDGVWLAQCVDYDIGAQAPNLDQLHRRFSAVLAGELQESMERQVEPFEGIDPAPEHFNKMWNGSPGRFEPKTQRTGVVDVEMALVA